MPARWSRAWRNYLDIAMLAGGLTIEAGGTLLGGIGVAGAPGGDKDEACARAGLDAIRDRIDF